MGPTDPICKLVVVNAMKIRDAVATDLPAIVGIYNSTIPSFIVTGDVHPISVESRLDWFQSHTAQQHPLWVVEQEAQVIAWLGFQPFYGRHAYAATAELSIYVAATHRCQGIGQSLLERAIDTSPSLGIKTLLGFIFQQNQPSLQLFEKFGFQRWGFLPRVAEFKGLERDLVIVGLRVQP